MRKLGFEEAAEKVASKVIGEGLVRIRNMRGHDEQQERMFSYISAEQAGAAGSSVTAHSLADG
jgi:hypothetical protein